MHTSSCLPATHTKQIGPENLQSFKLPLWPSLVCLCDWQVLLLNMLCAMVDVRACFYSEVFVVFLYVGPCPLCVSLSLRLRKLENNKCFHVHTGRWNALLVNIKLPLRVGKREGDGDGSYFFFPATRLLQRGREIEKQDVDEENDIKWQRFEETDYRFTLARGGGGRGGKKVYFPVDRCSPKSK